MIIGYKILGGIAACFYVYYLIILIRCLLTFLPGINWNNPIIKGLTQSVDIYLDLFRKFIPPVGPFDLSPIIAFFALEIIKWLVLNGLAILLHIIGLL